MLFLGDDIERGLDISFDNNRHGIPGGGGGGVSNPIMRKLTTQPREYN
jgi:hypothetical protein